MMDRPKSALAMLAGLYLALVVLVVATRSQLPERVATHFGINGVPNGWMSRNAHSVFLLTTAALTAVICAGSTYITRFLPESLINLPNRAYWLAPERRSTTNDKVFALGLWIACLTMALFIGLQLLVVRANQRVPVRLPATEGTGLLAAFLAGIGGLVVFSQVRLWRIKVHD